MNRTAVVALLVAIGFAAYFAFRPHPDTPAEPAGDTPAAAKPVRSAAAPRAEAAAKPSSPKKVATVAAPKQAEKPEDVVSFVVEDGLAIAFGDVILGKPEDEEIKTGFYQLAAPTPWERPEIPFAIDPEVPDPDRVLDALEHIRLKTGVHFVPYVDQPDGIVFQPGPKDCWSTLGRQGGLQPIKIAPKCTWHEITHEVLHSFGILHEQSRFDRDGYVEILWDNIDKPFHSQFERLPRELMGTLEMRPFDYQSIMLYDPRAFAKEKGQPTMRTKTENAINPSREGMSEGDIQKVKVLFRLD